MALFDTTNGEKLAKEIYEYLKDNGFPVNKVDKIHIQCIIIDHKIQRLNDKRL